MQKEISLTLTSRPISKKNSKILIKRGGRSFLIPSNAYLKFEKEALKEIQSQLPFHFETFKGKVHIDYAFVIKGKLRADVDNLIAGINDILEKAGVIENDNLVTDGCFQKTQGDDWQTTIKVLTGDHIS